MQTSGVPINLQAHTQARTQARRIKKSIPLPPMERNTCLTKNCALTPGSDFKNARDALDKLKAGYE